MMLFFQRIGHNMFSNSETHNYNILPVRILEPSAMLLSPAANGCKICILSKQINPLILGNDFESMATEPMIICGMQRTEILRDGRIGKNAGRGFCSPWCFSHRDSPFSEGPDLQNRSERDKKRSTTHMSDSLDGKIKPEKQDYGKKCPRCQM